jgi:hypothetical protein
MEELSELTESKSYWCTKLIDTIAPCVLKKFKTIFEETFMICNETRETLLYLKAFQNALSCVPEWSNTMIQKECSQITEMSKCDHLKELIATVHVVQLKIVTNGRPNNKHHSVRLSVPDTEVFIHNVYINTARELWKATFLFSREVDPLKQQENNYKLYHLIRSVIYKTIQDLIPSETFVRSYFVGDVEEEEEVIIEPIEMPEESVPELEPMSIAGNPFVNNGNPLANNGNPLVNNGNPLLNNGNPLLNTVDPLMPMPAMPVMPPTPMPVAQMEPMSPMSSIVPTPMSVPIPNSLTSDPLSNPPGSISFPPTDPVASSVQWGANETSYVEPAEPSSNLFELDIESL